MDREELKKTFLVVEETKAEICKFVKEFLEKERPIVTLDEPFTNSVNYEIHTKKYGTLVITFRKEEGRDYWDYVISAIDLCKTVIIPKEKEEFKAKGEFYIGCYLNHPKLLEPYFSLGKEQKFSEDYIV